MPSQDNHAIEYPCWYIPPGKRTVFGSKKGIISLSDGQLKLLDIASGKQVYKYKLYSDIQFKVLGGEVHVAHLNSRPTKVMDYQYLFYFYNPRVGVLSFAKRRYGGRDEAKRFIVSCTQAASLKPFG